MRGRVLIHMSQQRLVAVLESDRLDFRLVLLASRNRRPTLYNV